MILYKYYRSIFIKIVTKNHYQKYSLFIPILFFYPVGSPVFDIIYLLL